MKRFNILVTAGIIGIIFLILIPDAVLTDAEEALESIGELTGRTAKEEIVGAVFSRFCVGK